jgi:HK97 family phage major capsid protein
MTRIAEIQQALDAALAAVRPLTDRALKENRAFNTEEQAQFDKGSADVLHYTKLLQTERAAEEARGLLSDQQAERVARIAAERGVSRDQVREEEQAKRLMWRQYLQFGLESLAPEQQAEFRAAFPHRNADGDIIVPRAVNEKRAQVVGTNTAGGYTVPTDFYNGIVIGQKAFSGIMEADPWFMDTDGGNTLQIPTGDDTSNVATLIAENTAATDADVTFGQTSISAYKYTTGLIKISAELLQDSALDVEAYIQGRMAERLGRGWNAAWTTGTGSSQPAGIVTGAALGKTTAAVAAVTSDEILDLIFSVDRVYRNGAKLMFNDSTLLAILKLKDSQNRPLFQPSYVQGSFPTVHGYPFVVNTDMASMATTAKFMLFGQMKAFMVRRVRALTIRRLVERYAESDLVAFVGFARMDSKVINPGINPIKYMKNA